MKLEPPSDVSRDDFDEAMSDVSTVRAGAGDSEISVEACISDQCSESDEKLHKGILVFLRTKRQFANHRPMLPPELDLYLSSYLQKLTVSCPYLDENLAIELTDCDMKSISLFLYRCYKTGPTTEELDEEDSCSENGEQTSWGHQWILPNEEFEPLWKSLYFSSNIKYDLLNYGRIMLHYADCGIDPAIVTSNRLILLHGPPGTGKTTLCKALAQKIAIRLSSRYRYGQLIEINSHSLFSKWFSESGKLVTRMFARIREMVEDPEALVFLLIDEVESLSMARKAALNGNEPSDSVRVVNALLTQIDSLRRYPNVLVLATSNFCEAVDEALLDRADIRQYIGPPNEITIYAIYRTCISELQAKGIIQENGANSNLMGVSSAKKLTEDFGNNEQTVILTECTPRQQDVGRRLMEISKASVGLAGRQLRKLPMVAHARYSRSLRVTLDQFLRLLNAAVVDLQRSKKGEGEVKPEVEADCNGVVNDNDHS